MTSDEYPAYEIAAERASGEPIPTARGAGRPRAEPGRQLPDGLTYASAHKNREGDRAVAVDRRLAFVTPGGLESDRSGGERGGEHRVPGVAGRGRDAREARRTHRISKDWQAHEAMANLTMLDCNFSRAVRTLRVEVGEGNRQGRLPAIAAGLADHVLT